MAFEEEIEKAIHAHQRWNSQLKLAFQTHLSETTPEIVEVDNACAFGQWLYSLPSNVRSTPQWKEIHALHAHFHKETAALLRRALFGQKEAVSMGTQSPWATESARLIKALRAWQTSLKS